MTVKANRVRNDPVKTTDAVSRKQKGGEEEEEEEEDKFILNDTIESEIPRSHTAQAEPPSLRPCSLECCITLEGCITRA